MPDQKKVLFLVPYPLHQAPSQRFRVELFIPVLEQYGITYRIEPFLDAATWTVLYSQSSALKKAWGVSMGFLKRLLLVLFVVPAYPYVFVHREASPIGPPIFEFIISKIWRKKLIYDFDDAIWIPNTSQENRLVSWVKAAWKVAYICRWSYKVVGGNEYLCRYARQYATNVVLVPTCVDTVAQHNTRKEQNTDTVVVGWTGSHSTLKFLDALVPVLEKAGQDFKVGFVIICNKPPEFKVPNLRFITWNEATEISDLLKLNIGIMPLEADAWCEGKCGFKLIQYLALGIPAIASPIGVNRVIIEEGVTGFLCETDAQWYKALAVLINDAGLRQKMGEAGSKKIIQQYSLQANARAFAGLFE